MSKIMQKDKADDYAQDFVAACKEGYVKHAPTQELIKSATLPDWVSQNGLWYYKGALLVPNHYPLRQNCTSKYQDSSRSGHPDHNRTI